ncbi:GlsB/YeaQ/YmgE family stress response membrane protein [Ornithinimicrobium panacihumi]|uniref:GlsB/YeaQ/YmgE family stress response membrane protein n=1 Tax=Ornithinimicrobium panacihumi TaxID=2008449 RepID=UPI003F8C10C0
MDFDLGTLVAALVAGCIVGPLARLILPGRQNLSAGMTVLLGAIGSLLGALAAMFFFDYSGGLLNPWGLVLGIIGALVVVLAYGAITGKDNTHKRIS